MLTLLKDYLPRQLPGRQQLGWLLLPVLIAVCLLTFDRYGVELRFETYFGPGLAADGMSSNQIRFFSQMWLSGACVLLMVALPTLYLLLLPLPGGWGLGLPTHKRFMQVYAVLLLLMVPVLWLVAGRSEFNTFYPLYNPQTLQLWFWFELLYLSQFFCVEYFFRGPLLFRLHHRFGLAAIGMMTVPYALIHIYKPFPEALGSIAAGLLLGFLALKIRSIWPGVLLHCGVALTMDVFALYRSGRLAVLLS